MGRVSVTPRLRVGEFQDLGANPAIAGIPEDQFFSLQRSGKDTGEYWPLPHGVTHWNNAYYKGCEALTAVAGVDVFFIVDDEKYGLALFHYVYANEDHSELRWSNDLPFRSIEKMKGVFPMATTDLNALSQVAAQGRGMTPMNLSGAPAPSYNPVAPASPAYQPTPAPAGDGIVTGAASVEDLRFQAKAGGYVFGYVMKNAPAISIALKRTKDKHDKVTYNLEARQSKPSGLLKVLMALPSRCIKHNGALATAEEISDGNVDFNIPESDISYFAIDEIGAAGYITALGGALPEYRPNVVDGPTKQWSASEITHNSSDVSYVVVRASVSKTKTTPSVAAVDNGKPADDQGIKFHLKCDGPRRSLYTQKNIMCLRALEHVNVPIGLCSDESQAYQLNECAFGGWRHRMERVDGKKTTRNVLQVALSALPEKLWTKKYENITVTDKDGKATTKTVDEGIGSVYFMCTTVDKNGRGEEVKQEQLQYVPWYEPGGKDAHKEAVTQITRRAVVPTKNGESMRSVPFAILWRDVKFNNATDVSGMFTPYEKFASEVTKKNFMSPEALKSLSDRAPRITKKSKEKKDKQDEMLQTLLKRNDVANAINAVRKDASAAAAADLYRR